jgi:predicted RNA binding protein YcfA (HicA-like mRNA interferase family)
MLYYFYMKAKELVRELERMGWRLERIKGSHHVFQHEKSARPVVVPMHGSDIPEIWARSILKQAARSLGRNKT